MQKHTLVALAAQGFRGFDGLTLSTSLEKHGMIWQKGMEYFTFLYAVDHETAETNVEREYSFGVVPVDATRESEYGWVTMEQWHKIAQNRGQDIGIILSSSIPQLTFMVYEYLGATAIFMTPNNRTEVEGL
jgi:hypothetical protein